VRVFFDFSHHSLCPGREDCNELRGHLLWQPNPGQPPQPLDKIASGGELSRFLLAVVSIMSRASEDDPTLIFDEVDAGIGGLTLNRVADSLSSLAATHQMLLITHWPQLASRAARHFMVRKEVVDGQTYTHCQSLKGAEIHKELLRMSGDEGQE
jgi:DNA repair protein RecN (Recombination protein N)